MRTLRTNFQEESLRGLGPYSRSFPVDVVEHARMAGNA